MGLDMYLYKKHYVKNWDHEGADEKKVFSGTKGGKPIEEINFERVSEITEQVAYWRKANQIHNWFVKNVQNGEDDGDEYYVSREQLVELLYACERVLNGSVLVEGKVVNGYTVSQIGKVANLKDGLKIQDASLANEVLPITSGFFFGSTDYDEYYWQDLVYTRDTIKALMAEPGGGGYYYDSSF